MNKANRIAALALVMIGVLWGLPDTARSLPEYVEDFSTDTNMNPAGTDLDWDTEAGEIRLWPFEATIIDTYDTPGNTARSIEVNGENIYVAGGRRVIYIACRRRPQYQGCRRLRLCYHRRRGPADFGYFRS